MTEESKKDQMSVLDPVYNEPRVNKLIQHGDANAARINNIMSVDNLKKLTAVSFAAILVGLIWTFGASWVAKSTTQLLGGGITQQESLIDPIADKVSDFTHTITLGHFGKESKSGSGGKGSSDAALSGEKIRNYFEVAQSQVPISKEIASLVSVSDIPDLVADLSDVSLKNWDFPVSEGTFVTMEYLAENGAINPLTDGLDGFLVVPSSFALFGNVDLSKESYEKDFLVTGWALNEQNNEPVLVFGAVHEGEFFDLALTEADRLSGYEKYTYTDLPIFLRNIQLADESKYSDFGSYAESTWNYEDYMTALRSLDIDESRVDQVYPPEDFSKAITAIIQRLNETGEFHDGIAHVKTESADLQDFQNSQGIYNRMVVMQKPGSKDMLTVFPVLGSDNKVQVSALFLSYTAPESEEGEGTYKGTFIVPTLKGETPDKTWATFGDYPVLRGNAAQKALMNWGSDAYREARNQNNNDDK
jgi:hypothetical protein